MCYPFLSCVYFRANVSKKRDPSDIVTRIRPSEKFANEIAQYVGRPQSGVCFLNGNANSISFVRRLIKFKNGRVVTEMSSVLQSLPSLKSLQLQNSTSVHPSLLVSNRSHSFLENSVRFNSNFCSLRPLLPSIGSGFRHCIAKLSLFPFLCLHLVVKIPKCFAW